MALISDVLIGVGVIYFVVRSVIQSVQPGESFARDLMGFPILEPGLNVTFDIWLQSIIGFSIPFVFVLAGLLISKFKSE